MGMSHNNNNNNNNNNKSVQGWFEDKNADAG